MSLPEIDFIINDLARMCHQLRSLEYIIMFHRNDPKGLTLFKHPTLDALRAAYTNLETIYFERALKKVSQPIQSLLQLVLI